MFSLATTFFYMLSAYIAFLIGYSGDLSWYLIFLVTIGFVCGYLLDRLSDVKKIWAAEPAMLIKFALIRYLWFLFLAGFIVALGQLLTTW